MKDENDKVKKEGDTIVDEKLAVTLERIAADPESFYTGELADDILADLADVKSIIVEKDFEKDLGFALTLDTEYCTDELLVESDSSTQQT